MLKKIKRKFKQLFLGSKYKDDDLKLVSEEDRSLIMKIREARLTYLSNAKLSSLVNTMHQIENTGIVGGVLEAGCALGGSSILLAKLKTSDRCLKVYDVFEMIPAPSEKDTVDVHKRYKSITEGKAAGLGGDKYYGYEDDLYNKVISNFSAFDLFPKPGDLELIKGLVQDTMVISEPIAMAHIDVDWYDPVMTCLQRIYPMLSVGGSIILDDYYAWGGCRKATDEFLKSIKGTFHADDSAGSMKITKISANS
jgi:Macrocin-O-methyltransferase (TylF)